MLNVTTLRALDLHAGSSAERPAYLSAASGMVCVGEQLYVVADDEIHLAMFSLDKRIPGKLLRLFPGELPHKVKKRKKQKPDLEVLTLLPPFAGYRRGGLLALGSGSTQQRYRGALLQIDSHGAAAAPRILDGTRLFTELAQHFEELNLEGAWTHGNELCLLQRGNKGDSPNAVICVDLRKFIADLMHGDELSALAPLAIHPLQLGEIDGTPLSFTDACGLPDGRWLFSAVAEDTDSAYADGACRGAVLGLADAKHQLLWIKRVSPTYKIEGITVQPQAARWQLLMVTDADDPDVSASLLSACISL
jgi:hypothetical protein